MAVAPRPVSMGGGGTTTRRLPLQHQQQQRPAPHVSSTRHGPPATRFQVPAAAAYPAVPDSSGAKEMRLGDEAPAALLPPPPTPCCGPAVWGMEGVLPRPL